MWTKFGDTHEGTCDGLGGQCGENIKWHSHKRPPARFGWRVDDDGHIYCPGCKRFNPIMRKDNVDHFTGPLKRPEVNPEVGKHYLTGMGTATIKFEETQGMEARWYGETGEGTRLFWTEFGEAWAPAASPELVATRLPEFDLKEEIVTIYMARWKEPGEFGELRLTPYFTTYAVAESAAWDDVHKYQRAHGHSSCNISVEVESMRIYRTTEQAKETKVGELLEHLKNTLPLDEWTLLQTRLK